ncbi:AAA family ATPase [Micromonospora aurantiaca (nom. illeg.)]|uniref:hypothetical protein n=1 Tax=Micromonospora aurantiaca (nom. illeg.) TaxID=47850 RepID=UPI0036BE6E75
MTHTDNGIVFQHDWSDIPDFADDPPDGGYRLPDSVAPPPQDQPPADDEPDSWEPVPLRPYLDGTHKPIVPSLGIARSDGLRMIYPGKEHTIVGEMESGKSWFAAACAVAEILAGRHVVYVHFEEAIPAGTTDRLIALGLRPDVIEEQFHFYAPARPARPEDVARMIERHRPSLMVADGVNEAMALHRQAINDVDGAAEFRRRLIKPFLRAGAATLAGDHVVKDQDGRGRYALGSIHKGNALDGAQFLIRNKEPFGRGRRGYSHLFVAKDRPGYLRQHGQPTKTPGITYMGTLTVDDTRSRASYLELTLYAPRAEVGGETQDQPVNPEARDDAAILAVIRESISGGRSGTSKRAVRGAATKMSSARVDAALERLLTGGQITKSATGYRPADDLIPPDPSDADLSGDRAPERAA